MLSGPALVHNRVAGASWSQTLIRRHITLSAGSTLQPGRKSMCMRIRKRAEHWWPGRSGLQTAITAHRKGLGVSWPYLASCHVCALVILSNVSCKWTPIYVHDKKPIYRAVCYMPLYDSSVPLGYHPSVLSSKSGMPSPNPVQPANSSRNRTAALRYQPSFSPHVDAKSIGARTAL